MVKHFCDACGKESPIFQLEHFAGKVPMLRNEYFGIFVDVDSKLHSEKKLTKDLCAECYNEIVGEAIRSIDKREGEEKHNGNK